MTKLVMPAYETHKYAKNHFSFLHQYAELAGITVELSDQNPRVYTFPDKWVISCLYNNKQIIFDYADHAVSSWNDKKHVPYFKFHYVESLHGKERNIFPCTPSLVADKRMITPVADYIEYRKTFEYSPTRKVVHKQRAYAGALHRRNMVNKMLCAALKSDLDSVFESTHKRYWDACRNACGVVFVPGACNNMLDRGQLELIGLGVCTISPKLPEMMTNTATLEPNVHYILCEDDYSDLTAIIKNLQKNPEISSTVGKNAREWFDKNATPEAYWNWIEICTTLFV